MYFERRYSYSDDPWFRIGNYGVSTTTFVVGVGVLSMIVWAAEGAYGPLFRHLVLLSEGFGYGSAAQGQLWRLLTWPIPNEPSIWTIILFAIFYMLGNQLERLLGRWRFALFLIALTLVPAAVVTVLEVVAAIDGVVAGLRMVEVGVLVAFAAHYSQARFWPGIPGWVIAVVIVGLDALQAIGARDEYQLVVLVSTVAVALLGIRGFGYATQLTWVPKISLARSAERNSSRAPSQSHKAKPNRRQAKKTRNRTHLRAVPVTEEPANSEEMNALLDQVSSKGLDSLTAKQRKQLEAFSKRLRRRR